MSIHNTATFFDVSRAPEFCSTAMSKLMSVYIVCGCFNKYSTLLYCCVLFCILANCGYQILKGLGHTLNPLCGQSA